MEKFMSENFLLTNPVAQTLYHKYAENMPIIDYHCHVNPQDIAGDRRYDSISEVWLWGDHYKWRLMRAEGFMEEEITALRGKDDQKLFENFAACMPKAIGNPLFHWAHLELKRYFGIQKILNKNSAAEIYAECNQKLQAPKMSVRGLIEQSNVKLLCTTDDPVDTLEWHESIRKDPSCKVKVLPAFRPDKALGIGAEGFCEYVKKLGMVAKMEIQSFSDLCKALLLRIDFFNIMGCKASDHGLEKAIFQPADFSIIESIFKKALQGQPVNSLEIAQYQTVLLQQLAKEYTRLGWVMQIHFGCMRNSNSKQMARMGPDGGFDCMNGDGRSEFIAPLLDSMDVKGQLPKTVLYSLNPSDGEVLTTIAGSFHADAGIPGKVQVGSAWWFNDTKSGMEKQLTDFANGSLLGNFIGMLTDSRSFLSYTRHEYFRRILCNFLGTLVYQGEYPEDYSLLGPMVQDICFNNTCKFFGFDSMI